MDSVEPASTITAAAASPTPTPEKSRSSISPSSLIARRRRLEIRRFRFFAHSSNNSNITSSSSSSNIPGFSEPALKKPRSSPSPTSPVPFSNLAHTAKVQENPFPTLSLMEDHPNGFHHCDQAEKTNLPGEQQESPTSSGTSSGTTSGTSTSGEGSIRSPRCVATDSSPPHGAVYVCGRRREMEDAVAVVPSFMSVPCGTVGGCDCHLSGLGLGLGLGLGVGSGSGSGSVVSQPSDLVSTLHFFGVYDGHGGAQVAAFCKEHLHAAVMEELSAAAVAAEAELHPSEIESRLKKSMVASFLKVDSQLVGLPKNSNSNGGGGEENPSSSLSFVAPETSGSTAVVAVVGSDRIIVANCGDSRAVLSRGGRAIALSRDHKPDQVDELARVEAAGGRVIFWNGYRVLGVLAMSRAIGDRYLKPFIIPEPDVTCTERGEEDECLILASDGLWDVISNEVACEIARKCLFGKHRNNNNNNHLSASEREDSNAELAAGILTKFAIAKGSCDNISVVVVDLKSRRQR